VVLAVLVLAVLGQAIRLQALTVNRKALVPAMRLETLVPVTRPKALRPAIRLTMQWAACGKAKWSYVVDMDGRFLRPGRRPSKK
jgi:hypothetical protein